MSDTLDAVLAADEARYRDSVVKSDVVVPAQVGAGGEPVTEPVEKLTEIKVEDGKPVETKVETKPDEDTERSKRNRDAESQRWARMTAKLGDADRDREQLRAETARLKAELERLQRPAETTEGGEQQPRADAPMSKADFERMVKEQASVLRAQEKQQEETQAFNAECNRVAAQGETEYGKEDFDAAMSGMFAMAGSPQVGASLIEAALETDAPHAVLYHLGKNPADVMRLADLKPTKLGAAVAKIASSLSAKADAPAPRVEISRAPAPLEPVAGGARADAGAMGPRSMADWIKWDAERSKRK